MEHNHELDFYIEQAWLQDPEAIREDPLPHVTVSVKEAYELGLLQDGVELYYGSYIHNDENLTFDRVYSISPYGERVDVYLVDYSAVKADRGLYIFAKTPTEKVLYAKWLSLLRERNKLKYGED